MKILKRVLAVFSVLHWIAVIYSTAHAVIGWYFFRYLSDSQRALYYWLNPTTEGYGAIIIAAIVGMVISAVITVIGLRNPEKSLKAECGLLLAFALSTLPISYSIITMAMSV